MQNLNDNQNDGQFELELKQFRPLAPKPFLIEKINRPARHKFVRVGWLAATAILAVGVWSTLPHRPLPTSTAGTSRRVSSQPLTLGRTNALLAASPSYKAALDAMALQAQPAFVAQDKRSAIAELSKQRIKL